MIKVEFLQKLNSGVKLVEDHYGIKPIITQTQAAHESGWGNSGLTLRANNLFGYTANKSWLTAEKPVIKLETTEYSNYPPEKVKYWNTPDDIIKKEPYNNGSKLIVLVPFRSYKSWDESVLDWANTIATLVRYFKPYAWAKSGSLKEYAYAIKEAGYATDPNYADQLIQVGEVIKELLHEWHK